MSETAKPHTIGADHIGLAVRDLALTQSFFNDCLGWSVVGGVPSYPASFVSDGSLVVTLWQVEDPERATAFDRHQNVGLHHLALRVAGLPALEQLHAKVAAWPGVSVEFAPQQSGKGPKVHFIIREPSGIRVEFACDPRI